MLPTLVRDADPAFRRTYIGGSDAAAIVGLGKWASPYSVWLEKTGQAPERDEPSERMRWGTLLESPVAEEWARREGVARLIPGRFQRMTSPSYVGGHADFLADHPADGRCLVEVKVSDRPSEWEDDTSVPAQYYLQVQHYLMVYGLEVGYLVVLLRGSELRSFRVLADPKVHTGLLEAYAAFWRLVEGGGIPEPDGHEATAQAIKARFPSDDGSEVVGTAVDALAVDRLLEARRVRKEAEAEETAASNVVKDRMGTSTRMLVPGVSVSWKQNRPSEVTDWKSVAEAYRMLLEDRGRAGWSEEAFPDLDTIESIHTNTIPGARVLRVTTKAEE